MPSCDSLAGSSIYFSTGITSKGGRKIVSSLQDVGRSSLHGRGLSIIVSALLHTTSPLDHTSLTGRAKLAGTAVSVLISLVLSGNVIRRKRPFKRSLCKHPDVPLVLGNNKVYNVKLRVGASNCNVVIRSVSNAVIDRR